LERACLTNRWRLYRFRVQRLEFRNLFHKNRGKGLTMNSGKYLFTQLMDSLPKRDFERCVRRYKGNYRIRQFSCYDQFLCMAFAQKLTGRHSLRDIETCLNSIKLKLYHLGFR